MRVSKSRTFEAAHWIPGHPKCGVLHGHSYTVTIYCEGPVDPKTGMVVDFGNLSNALNSVHAQLDHSCLNKPHKVVFSRDTFPADNPTVENLAVWILDLLRFRMQEMRFGGNVAISVREGFGGEVFFS